jgi:hypothetical protein
MSEMIDDVAPGAIEEPAAAAPECSVTYALNEEYTGFRTVEMPPAEEGGEPTTEQVPTRSISVTFTDGAITHQREVNVCFDADGAYDADATLVRIGEVARGVEQKIAAGVISAPAD